MKVSCTLAASVLAASAAALTSSASYASQDHSLALYHTPTSQEVSISPSIELQSAIFSIVQGRLSSVVVYGL